MQLGALGCVWQVDARHQLYVTVLPEADQIFADYVVEGVQTADAARFGDASAHGCRDFGDGPYCEADVLVEESWVSLTLLTTATAGSLERFEGIVESVLQALPAPEGERWNPPASPLTPDLMLELDAGLVESAFSLPGAQPSGGDLEGIRGAIYGLSGSSWPTWYDAEGVQRVSFWSLPGGGWAASVIADRAGAQLVDIAGARHGSVVGAGNGDGYLRVCAEVYDALLCVDAVGDDPARAADQVEAFIAGLPL